MKEIIYMLTNEAMPSYVKIGKTTNLSQRLKSLDNTSVPLPFECVFAIEVDKGQCERLVHDAFADARVRKNREFFYISPDRVISALKLTSGHEVSLDVEEELDQEAKDALNQAKKRRDRFSFKMVDIPEDTELYFNKDEDITCKVRSNNMVEFEGEQLSLSNSALKVFHRMGYMWKTVSGPSSWCYAGETLEERRHRFETE